MIWKNNNFSVKEILTKHPMPDSWKYDKSGKVIKGARRRWCKNIIRMKGVKIRKMRLVRKMIVDAKKKRELNEKNKE